MLGTTDSRRFGRVAVGFLKAGATAGAGLVIGLNLPIGGTKIARAADASAFAPNAFVRVASGQQRHGVDQAYRVRPGHIHWTVNHRRRGTGCRLVADPGRARAGRRGAVQQSALGSGAGHRRKFQHSELLRTVAPGRRHGPGDAGRRRPPPSGASQSAGITVSQGVILSHPAQRPQRDISATSPKPRQCWCRRTTVAAEGPGRLHPDRHPRAAARFAATRPVALANYTIDVTQLPGLLTAVLERPPLFGSTVRSFDASAALAVDGVTDCG